MFVQDDQIRFAGKGSESGAVRGRKSCIMHVPAARPMSGAGTACLPWHIVRVGSAGCVELLLSVLFPFCC